MEKRKPAQLRMKKMLRTGGGMDENIYQCSVLACDEKTERLYMILEEGDLTALSLDAVYECSMMDDDVCVRATGRVQERYCSEEGKIVKIAIENGFYKNNIKSVDKIEV